MGTLHPTPHVEMFFFSSLGKSGRLLHTQRSCQHNLTWTHTRDSKLLLLRWCCCRCVDVAAAAAAAVAVGVAAVSVPFICLILLWLCAVLRRQRRRQWRHRASSGSGGVVVVSDPWRAFGGATTTATTPTARRAGQLDSHSELRVTLGQLENVIRHACGTLISIRFWFKTTRV